MIIERRKRNDGEVFRGEANGNISRITFIRFQENAPSEHRNIPILERKPQIILWSNETRDEIVDIHARNLNSVYTIFLLI